MSTPGKLFILTLLFFASLYGSVKAEVDENPVIAGESVEYEIEAIGESVVFPEIDKIGESNVSAEGSQRLEWFEENRSVVKWVKVYAFSPKKSVTIPSFKVIVDGKEEWTKPIFLQVKANAGNTKSGFRIELKASRTEAYVGQPVDVAVRFMERRDIPVMSVDFVPMKYENFWVKRVGKPKRFTEGNYLVHEVRYLFFPQKAGELTIGPAEVKVATAKKIRDAFGFIVRRPQWATMVSKPVTLFVKPLPEGVKLVGDYTLDVKAVPRKVEAGSPVTLTVRVEASGNIEDFELPPLRIADVTVYSEAPKIKQHYNAGRYSGSWEKRFVLISDRSFTIPPFKVRFFDPDEKRIKEVSSAPVTIEVTGGARSAGKRREPSRESNKKERGPDERSYLYYGAAFIAGMVVMYLILSLKNRVRRRVKPRMHAKNELQMLQRLLPYISESNEAAQMAENLYANLFEGKAVKIDKKMFEKLMTDLTGRE